MSSKRKKSRFTKTDVNTICEMQRKIDAYESYIMALAGYSRLTHTCKKYFVLEMGTDMDEWVNLAWKNIEKMKEEIENFKKT